MDEDRRKGALFGQAIGDALGVPWEFDETPPPEGYLKYDTNATVGLYVPGEWSDDTEQALCILDALNTGGDFERALAAQFRKWLETDGWGCGCHTDKVIKHPLFLTDPLKVSESVWEESGKNSAANGGVMRTATVPLYRPWDLKWIVDTTVTACKVTHWDKRCVASCVAVSVAIARLINGDAIPHAVSLARRVAEKFDPDCVPYIETNSDIKTLGLGTQGSIGYTYKCLSAGFWAVLEFQRRHDAHYEDMLNGRFHSVLSDIIRAGGDTDTNAAVAGAMLGAACGFKWIPKKLIEGLPQRNKLELYFNSLPVQKVS